MSEEYAATYIPGPGEHMGEACRNAVAQAKRRRGNVGFTFNDVFMVASPRRNPRKMQRAIILQWRRMEKLPRHYESVQRSRWVESERERDAQLVTTLQAALPAVLDTVKSKGAHDALMRWIQKLVRRSQWIGTPLQHQVIIDQLQAAGYCADGWHGHGAAWYNTRERMGRWIVAETMNCLGHGMPPHPVLDGFVDEYFKCEVTA